MPHDYKLALRMLLKFPGLTLAGGLALAIAIGIGAGWYEISDELLTPDLPLPEGERVVEIETRNTLTSQEERRIVRDFLEWRRELRTFEALGAYRQANRNLIVPGAVPWPIPVADITPAALRTAHVAPFLGRLFEDADTDVVILGYGVWQRAFAGRADAIGMVVKVGNTTATVVGVMPENFAYPVNQAAWLPLQLRESGYAPLEGGPINVVGRLARGVTREQANAEIRVLAERTAAAFPATHAHLRPRVMRVGWPPSDTVLVPLALTNLPILLVLIIACVNVGTLFYARTATREAEIAIRSALGASRARIVGQLFVEALALAGVAAAVGLLVADRVVTWGIGKIFEGSVAGPPFWWSPGLRMTTILYAGGMAVACAALLALLPALRATHPRLQSRLTNLGSGGSTLRFGRVWTTAMVAQVALTVMAFPPARGIAEETLRDRKIHEAFPAEQYLSTQIELARLADESDAQFVDRLSARYADLERRVAAEPGVLSVTFSTGMPGVEDEVRRGQVEVAAGAEPVNMINLWTLGVGPGFFEAFERPIRSGRAFHGGDRVAEPRTVIVNEAFARRLARLTGRSSPLGLRVRLGDAGASTAEPWLEIVGIVRDIGMTPTDFGEAPFVYRPAAVVTATPLVMGVRARGDAAALGPRLRRIAADVDPGMNLDELRTLDEDARLGDVAAMSGAGGLVAIVMLGLFLSASAIFALTSVTVSRRMREIGLRTALGASPRRVLTGIFSRAFALVGCGVAAGSAFLLLVVGFSSDAAASGRPGALAAALVNFSTWLAVAGTVMLVAGLVACIQPARRALRISPTDALRDV